MSAMARPGFPITVDQVEIRTATVEVRTLTLTRKQVTLSVFRQLPERDPIDWDTGRLLGEVWGWVNYLDGQEVWVADATLWRFPRHTSARLRKIGRGITLEWHADELSAFQHALQRIMVDQFARSPCGEDCSERECQGRPHVHWRENTFDLTAPWWPAEVLVNASCIEQWYNNQRIFDDHVWTSCYLSSAQGTNTWIKRAEKLRQDWSLERATRTLGAYQDKRDAWNADTRLFDAELNATISRLELVPQLFIAV